MTDALEELLHAAQATCEAVARGYDASVCARRLQFAVDRMANVQHDVRSHLVTLMMLLGVSVPAQDERSAAQ
jgi:hypothetical protein